MPSNKDITFIFQATDRFGNVSEKKQIVIPTKSFDEPVPSVIITPDVPLENGFYHSIYPVFNMSISSATNDSLTLETVLKYNNGAVSDSTSLSNVSLIDTTAHVWSVAVDSSYPLSPFPDTGGISSTNGYSIRARVMKRNGTVGDWTQLIFGVRADTSQIPPSVEILDSTYETSALAFRFLRGIEVSSQGTVRKYMFET